MSKEECYVFTKLNSYNEVEYYGVRLNLIDKDTVYKFETKAEADAFVEDYKKFMYGEEEINESREI